MSPRSTSEHWLVKFHIFRMAICVMVICQPAMADINYVDFNNTDMLVLVGDAAPTGGVLRVTPAQQSHKGAAWHVFKQDIVRGFQTEFRFQISEMSPTPADGFAFVIQNSGVAALGEGGSGMCYAGIANSLAIEVDTFNLYSQTIDPSVPHISVQSRGTEANGYNHEYSLGVATNLNVLDEEVHTLRVAYTPGTLSVYLDAESSESAIVTVAVDLSELLSLDEGKAWVGFTAGGGRFYENHDILSWSFTEVVPLPSALMLGYEYDPTSSLASLCFTDEGQTYSVNLGDGTSQADQTILVSPANGNVDTSVAGECTFQFLDDAAGPWRFMWITSE